MKPEIRFKGISGDWTEKQLKDIAVFNPKAKLPEVFEYVDLESVVGTEMIAHRTENKETAPSRAQRLAQTGDLFFQTVRPYQKNNYLFEKPDTNYVFSTGYAQMRPLIDGRFLFGVIREESFVSDVLDNCTGSSYPAINSTTLAELKVKVPLSAEETESIGRFVHNLDTLIEQNQSEADRLRNLKKAMLQKMFPQKGSKVPEIRFKDFSDVWKSKKFSQIASMHARIGWQNLRKSEFLTSGDYYLITGTDFVDGRVDFANCHFVKKERYDQDPHIQVSNGSILITKDGTLGKVAYVSGLNKPATLNAGVFNVNPIDSEIVDTIYLYQYLKAPFLLDYVAERATGGTIKHLNQNILVDFPVLLPSVEEQRLIGQYFQDLDSLIEQRQSNTDRLRHLKQSMLQRMFV
jgi:type I restriction enzyme S subunit